MLVITFLVLFQFEQCLLKNISVYKFQYSIILALKLRYRMTQVVNTYRYHYYLLMIHPQVRYYITYICNYKPPNKYSTHSRAVTFCDFFDKNVRKKYVQKHYYSIPGLLHFFDFFFNHRTGNDLESNLFANLRLIIFEA